MARKIVITSGKGGVGKTTVTVNLGVNLAKLGYSVLLIDGDFGLNNLDIVMGLESKINYDIYDVAMCKCRAEQAIIQDTFNSNIAILPATKDIKGLYLPDMILEDVIAQLDKSYDYILIDSPAGIDKGFVRTLSLTHEAIIVTTPHISALRDADKVVSILRNVGFDMLSVVVNRARGDLMVSGESVSVDFIAQFLNLDILGVIPEDDEINNQLLIGGDIHIASPAFSAYKKLAKSIANSKIEIYDVTKRYRGLIGRIRRILKKMA